MTTHTHARRRFPRLAALLGHDDARPQRPFVSVGVPGFEVQVPVHLPGPPFAREERHGIDTPETLAAIVAEAQQGTAPAPQEETEPWGPWDKPDGLLMNEQDEYAPPARPYFPEPPAYVLDIFADIRDLPALRDAIRATMQRGCTECGTCGRTVPGRDWQERFAAQLAHLGSGVDAASSGTFLPAELAQDEAETAEIGAAA